MPRLHLPMNWFTGLFKRTKNYPEIHIEDVVAAVPIPRDFDYDPLLLRMTREVTNLGYGERPDREHLIAIFSMRACISLARSLSITECSEYLVTQAYVTVGDDGGSNIDLMRILVLINTIGAYGKGTLRITERQLADYYKIAAQAGQLALENPDLFQRSVSRSVERANSPPPQQPNQQQQQQQQRQQDPQPQQQQ